MCFSLNKSTCYLLFHLCVLSQWRKNLKFTSNSFTFTFLLLFPGITDQTSHCGQALVSGSSMWALLLLSHFSRVRLCATPQMAAHQAPSSLGFSRQEHWSGLPFPSPMHESEKWKWSRSVMSNSSRPHGLQPSRLLRPWDFPGKSTGVGCHCLLRPYPLENCKTGIKHFIRNMLIPMRNRKSMGYAQNFIQGQRKIG